MTVTGIKISIDRGGTFTDCIGNPGTGHQDDDVVIKLLSVDPQNYSDSNLEGIRRLLEQLTGKKHERGKPLDTSAIASLRLGTTVATNALLERKGSRCALITTKGFRDLLNIGNQSRPDIFDLSIKKPDILFETVVEIDERVTLEDYTEDPIKQITEPIGEDLVKGLSSETIRILKKPNVEEIKSTLNVLFESGIRSIAICLMHSYTFPNHEQIVAAIAEEIGFGHISLSSSLSPMIKYVSRANSAVVDAYLTPEIKNYLSSFQNGLRYGFFSETNHHGVNCHFMQSDGGLVDASRFTGLKAILSGPAGGVVGYSKTCYDHSNNIPLIGFDMGGTSTDVSRFGDGKLDHVFETTTAGVTIQSPQLDINTVAAGGGSILSFKNGLLKVGPESASSHPGPACYRKGGPLTVTDANLMLGRLVPEYFPKIFGIHENEGLDIDATVKKFQLLTNEINQANPNSIPMTPHQVAYGFLKIANETMARPIRQLTEVKGHVLKEHRLVSFGGAGGQCACDVARILDINTVLIHRYSSVLSAYGMALADVVEDIQEPASNILNDENKLLFMNKFESLKESTFRSLSKQGFSNENIEFEFYLNMRYLGTESSIMVRKGETWDFAQNFNRLHEKEFGFSFEKEIIVDDVRVRAIGKNEVAETESIDSQIETLTNDNLINIVSDDKIEFVKECYDETGFNKTTIYRLENLNVGTKIIGPAIIADNTQTNVIPSNSYALILKSHIVVKLQNDSKQGSAALSGSNNGKIDPVMLSIFGHRFTDIADQMGVSLQKTSVSVNVKERLDFSCALFDSDGNLVANAPHVPVHLGSMSTCIKAQLKIWKDKLKDGDVLITNHPSAGGTHLPDITVISPVFKNGKLIFITASRAHHADIGGILPGSMPPSSTELWQEGAAFYSELLVTNNEFQEDMLKRIMIDVPSQYVGCSGARRFSDNISDIKAQIAANRKGISLIENLTNEFDINMILTYMKAIQINAADTVSKMLKKVVPDDGKFLHCRDFMDDSSFIDLEVYRDNSDDKVVFDFTKSSPQAYNNFNAPVAITYSAIIYVLRCMINEEIPLNQGCLNPIKVKVAASSILCPDSFCAVVGGNVCTSQRITDTILKAFNIMADSQGCCNNFTFGRGGKNENGDNVEGFGYYETIAGGHGASANWNGVSGVHTNMTNTRITDAEVFEKRYPVLLTEFSINKGTGGNGKFKGGDGVIREIEFREPVVASILSERRVIAPHGLHGGEDGKKGVNLWIKKIKDSKGNVTGTSVVNIGGRNTVHVGVGDRIRIETPGGGGYGDANARELKNSYAPGKNSLPEIAGGSLLNRKKEQYEN
jgi:5-oxoprolinase (ATP-hydrolysing)